MNDTEILPAPVLDLGPKSKWERERAAFRRLLPELLQTHRNKYVAIHEEKIVGSGEDLFALARRVYEEIGYIPIYMDLVTDQPAVACRVPHYRILTKT